MREVSTDGKTTLSNEAHFSFEDFLNRQYEVSKMHEWHPQRVTV